MSECDTLKEQLGECEDILFSILYDLEYTRMNFGRTDVTAVMWERAAAYFEKSKPNFIAKLNEIATE